MSELDAVTLSAFSDEMAKIAAGGELAARFARYGRQLGGKLGITKEMDPAELAIYQDQLQQKIHRGVSGKLEAFGEKGVQKLPEKHQPRVRKFVETAAASPEAELATPAAVMTAHALGGPVAAGAAGAVPWGMLYAGGKGQVVKGLDKISPHRYPGVRPSGAYPMVPKPAVTPTSAAAAAGRP
jgi:hypothetical protein